MDPKILQELPHFLKMREIDLFAQILFLDGENSEHPWSARYLRGRRERLDAGIPYIDFDWGSLADFLG